MRKLGLGALMAVVALLAASGGAWPAPAPVADEVAEIYDYTWARGPLWDDGQAEVALYQAKRPQYGRVESYQAVLIVVKEDFNRQLHVKADPPFAGKTLLPVLKLNAVHSYWTPNYPYHYLASVFVERAAPTRLVKMTVGSQEWCGNTFKEVKTWGGQPELVYHTYFDGQADGRRSLDLRPGDLFEEQLPLALRSLAFTRGLEVHTRVVRSLLSNSLRRQPEFVDAVITVAGEEPVATGAGRFSAWKVGVELGDVQQTWWFEKESPHTLLKMESTDDRSWLLEARTRKPYWSAPTYQPEM
ncbi:MAG: hypothetical protein ACE5HB_01820 [Terriglobia bacterium]